MPPLPLNRTELHGATGVQLTVAADYLLPSMKGRGNSDPHVNADKPQVKSGHLRERRFGSTPSECFLLDVPEGILDFYTNGCIWATPKTKWMWRGSWKGPLGPVRIDRVWTGHPTSITPELFRVPFRRPRHTRWYKEHGSATGMQ